MKQLLLLAFWAPFSIFSQEYDYVEKINKHLSVVCKEEKCGLMRHNQIIYPLGQYSFNQSPFGGLFIISDSLMGMTDELGNLVIPVKYAGIDFIDNNLAIVNSQKEGELGLIDSKGKIIVPLDVQDITAYGNVAHVKKGNQQAIYSLSGELIIPFGLHELYILDDNGDVLGIKKAGESHYIIHLNDQIDVAHGFVSGNSRLMMKQTEVTIKDYLSFIVGQRMDMYISKDDFTELLYTELLPDTTKVEAKFLALYRKVFEKLKIEEPTVRYEMKVESNEMSYTMYLPFKPTKDELALMDFPITGISKKQVEYYIKWLNLIHSEISYNEYGYISRFRLPTEQEWIELAESGLNEKMKANHVLDSINIQNCMLFIFSNMPACKGYDKYITASKGGGTVKVVSMNPDLKGAYQFFGNVAEMTSENGIAKGGSFFHSASEAKTSKRQMYSGPEPWLGFRLVAEYYFE